MRRRVRSAWERSGGEQPVWLDRSGPREAARIAEPLTSPGSTDAEERLPKKIAARLERGGRSPSGSTSKLCVRGHYGPPVRARPRGAASAAAPTFTSSWAARSRQAAGGSTVSAHGRVVGGVDMKSS